MNFLVEEILRIPSRIFRFFITLLKSKGGIFLPDSGKKLNEGIIVAVGMGEKDKNGSREDLEYNEGERVILPEYGGTSVTIEDVEYSIYRADEILDRYLHHQ